MNNATFLHTQGRIQISVVCICLFMMSWLLYSSCSSDILPPQEGCSDTNVKYSNNVKEIIDKTCAYAGCHNGISSAPGDYRTYDGLRRYIEDGSFIDRVIEQRDNPSRGMPHNQSVYSESIQDDLTAAQLEIITCWIQNNVPE